MIEIIKITFCRRQAPAYPAVNIMAADGLATQGAKGISSHGIDLILPEYSAFSARRVNNDCCGCRCLVHLSRAGAEVAMFAPDIQQMHVINHTKGEPMEESRSGLGSRSFPELQAFLKWPLN